jgi:3'-phosphoadenosine 5'-phosphosulfate sulfotransferase (PAPS reductase)/FAD synthetase
MMNVIAYSGGKDSTALICWAKDQGMDFIAVFCDTGWEHPITYAYIEKINKTMLGGKLITIKSEKYDGMADLVEKKGRVPSAKARFCTDNLKVKPMIDWVKSQDDEITLYQGIRAEESPARSRLPMRQWSDAYDCWIERPLFRWTAEQCFNLSKKHGIEPNPLYLMGARRVGCFPCIMITQGELKRLSDTTPEIWDRIAELEKCAKGGSFFPPNFIPRRFETGYDPKSGKSFPKVEDVKNYVLNEDQGKLFDEPTTCLSIYNLCE